MDLDKEYYSDGIKCNILEMVKREPEWAANRLQEGEKHFNELCALRNATQPVVQSDADGEITGVCKCGEELYVETVDGEKFITCR